MIADPERKRCPTCCTDKRLSNFDAHGNGKPYVTCKSCCGRARDRRAKARAATELANNPDPAEVFAADFAVWESAGYSEAQLPPSLNECPHTLLGARLNAGDSTTDEIVLVCMHPDCMVLWRTESAGEYPISIANVVGRADDYYSRDMSRWLCEGVE